MLKSIIPNWILVLAVELTAFIVSSCATMTKSWDDDFQQVGGQRGGTVTYLNQGVQFMIDERRRSAMEQIDEYCGSREVYFLGETSTTSYSQGTTAVNSYSSGTVSNGFQTANYSGTTTTYVPTTYVWNHNHATFVCADSDVTQRAYAIFPVKDGGPVCREIEKPFQPGNRRLSALEGASGSDNCVKDQGWLRYDNKNGKLHLFVGNKGKELCKSLENELVQQQIHAGDTNLYLRKRLNCGVATH